MNSFKWWKKALQVYVLSLVMVVTQVTVFPAFANDTNSSATGTSNSTPSVNTAFLPPGFTAEDFKTVEEVTSLAERNRIREDNRNAGKVDVEHDISSSKCRTQAANKEARMNDITTYRTLTATQGYSEICRLRQKLNQQTGGPQVDCDGLAMNGNSAAIDRTGELQSKDSKYKTDPGGQVMPVDEKDWEAKKAAAEARLAKAKEEAARLRKLVPELEAAYNVYKNRCEERTFGCFSREERAEYERRKKRYLESVVGLKKAEEELVAAQKHHDRYGRALIAERSNMAGAESDTLQNDENMKESDAFSGIQDSPDGNSGELSGPVYETNEQLRAAIDRYTGNAAAFAAEKIEYVRDLEFRNQNRGEYELYELSLAGYDGSRGSRMAMSNMDVMAMASASIKKLDCSKKRLHESKAYHIFRAASATYVSAIIRDKGSNQDFNECIKDEIFESEEQNDSQFETVERGLNSHTQIVDTMCTMVQPDPENIPEIEGEKILTKEQVQHLKDVCDASAGVACTNEEGEESTCAPRTRETALEMYRTALMIAQQELADKRQLVATAEANVEKGKKKIEATKRKIMVAAKLQVMHAILNTVFYAIGQAKNASVCACGAPDLIKAAFHDKKHIFWLALYAYYVKELRRWQRFTAKWEKKLDEAREHTHLACNYDEAEGSYATHENFANETRQKAQEAMAKAKEDVKGSIKEQGFGALNSSSSMIMPKGLNKTQKRYYVQFYLEKYIKVVGKTALDAIFPSAFANQDVTDNNSVATNSSMADSQRSAMAAGMAVGSTSFYHFILRQNTHWQDQAFDADPHPDPSTVGYAHNKNPIMYCNEQSQASGTTGSGGCIVDGTVGMPTPETRVRLLNNIVNLVQENLSGMLEHLNEAVAQRDKYVMLLNQMRTAMNLGVKGTDTQIEPKPLMQSTSCMKDNGNGQLEQDPLCACQKNNNCATLDYPDFGTFAPGVFANSEASIKKFADANLSGKLDEANVAAGEVASNSNAVRRKVRESFKDLNKVREENGFNKVDNDAIAKRDIAESRKSTFEKYTKTFPESFKAEKTRGGLSSYYNDFNASGGKGVVTRNSPALAAVGNSKAAVGSVAAKAQKGAKGKKDEMGFEFEWDVDDLSPEEIASLKKQKEDADALAALNAGQANGSNSRYGHQRKSYNSDGSYDNTGINKDTKKNLFSIISSRYKKSAFPLFLEDQFIR